MSALRSMGIRFPVPKGAFYIFPEVNNEREFVEELRRRHVIVTPGSAFGTRGRNHVRISYAANFNLIRQAVAIMREISEIK